VSPLGSNRTPACDSTKETSLPRTWVVVALMGALSLVACDKAEVLRRFASPEDVTAARNYIELLRQSHFDGIERAMDASITGPSTRQELIKMAALFPPGTPTSVTLVGAQLFRTSDSSTVNLTFEYRFGESGVLTNVALRKQGGNTTIVGFHVRRRQPKSLEAQNRFTLSGKSPLEYTVLAMMVVVPLLILWSLVSCLRTRLKGRKWPWVLFIIFGVGRLAVNWTTGAWGLQLLYVMLFGAGAYAPLYGPWTLSVSLPLGAIVFLLTRDKLRSTDVSSIVRGVRNAP
jgi:hypothetical protein